MSRLPLTATKTELCIAINTFQPNGMTNLEWEEWGQEKAKALDEWNADLPSLSSGAPVVCLGGDLIQSPISTAKPIPLSSESLEQQTFL